jgi:hypothetical protein
MLVNWVSQKQKMISKGGRSAVAVSMRLKASPSDINHASFGLAAHAQAQYGRDCVFVLPWVISAESALPWKLYNAQRIAPIQNRYIHSKTTRASPSDRGNPGQDDLIPVPAPSSHVSKYSRRGLWSVFRVL